MQSKIITAVLCVAILSLVALVDGQKGYTYPLRFEAQSSFWVSDLYVDNQKARGLAFIYTDYTIPAQRVDELFNTSSVYGTPLYDAGILSDTHLELDNYQYYFYTNDSGLVCFGIPFGLFPQNLFANPDTYFGDVIYNGIPCAGYIVKNFPILGLAINITLLVGKASEQPVSIQIQGVPGSMIGDSVGDYIYFQEITSFPSKLENALFSPPNGCPINGTAFDYKTRPFKIF